MESGRATGPEKIRVLVADSSEIHTYLLAEALKRDRALEVITPESDDSHSVITMAETHEAEILAISASLDEQPYRGLEVLRELRASHSEIRAVVLLDSSKHEAVVDAFRAGARGVFSRHDSIEMLGKCIRCVHQGQIWANSQETLLAIEALASAPTVRAVDASGLDLLSKREREIVQSLVEGLSNREIAERLGLSPHTVKNYLFRLFDKLGVSNRVELLFMTLSQSHPTRSAVQHFVKTLLHDNHSDEASLTVCRMAAEEGLLTAEIALARRLWSRRRGPEDLVHAYTWYLISNAQMAVASEQVSRAQKNMQQVMKPEQILEAEQRAADWLRRFRKMPSVGVGAVAADGSASTRAAANCD